MNANELLGVLVYIQVVIGYFDTHPHRQNFYVLISCNFVFLHLVQIKHIYRPAEYWQFVHVKICNDIFTVICGMYTNLNYSVVQL